MFFLRKPQRNVKKYSRKNPDLEGGPFSFFSLLIKGFFTSKIYVFTAICLTIFSIFLWMNISIQGQHFIQNLQTFWQESFDTAEIQLKNIKLQGLQRTSHQNILRLLPQTNENIALGSIDIASIHARVIRLPWVAKASIRRQWPNTLIVKIMEREPFALWQHNKKLNLIDVKGNLILVQSLKPYKNFPLLVGKQANRRGVVILKEINKTKNIKKYFKSVCYVHNRRWDVHLSNGQKILLPEKKWQQSLKKIDMLTPSRVFGNSSIKHIDARGKNIILRLDDKASAKRKSSLSKVLKKKPIQT